MPNGYVLKSATISETKSGKYYVSALYEYESQAAEIDVSDVQEENTIGLDYKTDGLYVDSNGVCADMPHFYRLSEWSLAKKQRRLLRKKKSSRNYKKLSAEIAKCSEHVAAQRRDFLYKTSSAITERYDVVCTKNLDMKAMSHKGSSPGKATLDNGYGEFVRMLEYKQRRNGHLFIKISKWFPSSQLCSCCGYKNPEVKNLKIRSWVCPQCGAEHDRDVNAAINIRTEGLRMLSAA